MRKVTLKLDAICAKLKKGLGDAVGGETEASANSLSSSDKLHKVKEDSLEKELNHNAIRSEETGETIAQSSPLTEDRYGRKDNGLDNGSMTSHDDYNNHVDDEINVQSQENNSSLYFNSSFDHCGDEDEDALTESQHRDTPVLDCVESEYRTSTPKSLSGASKRKSRGGGLLARRIVSGATPGDDAEENSNGERSLSSLPNGTTRDGLLSSDSGVHGKDEDDDVESQGSNANFSMQSLPDSSRLDENLNDHTKDVDESNNDDFEDSMNNSTTANGGVDTASFADEEDDESDPWGDSQASQDPWGDDDDDDDNDTATGNADVSYPESEHSNVDSSDLKAIREYAERSVWDNEETPEIEEGLASNDVITDVESVNNSNIKEKSSVPSETSSSQEKPSTQFPVPVLPYSVQHSLQHLPPPPSYDAATGMMSASSSHPKFDQKAVKDYATDTMKELLGMYGYEEAGKDIDKHVPLDNFNFSK